MALLAGLLWDDVHKFTAWIAECYISITEKAQSLADQK